MPELEDIKKLPPQERLKKLKELEEQRKKEEVEAKRILEDSLDEIQKEDEKEQTPTRHVEELIDEIEEDSIDAEVRKEEKILIEANTGADYGMIGQIISPKFAEVLDKWAEYADAGKLSEQYQDTIREMYDQVNVMYEAVNSAAKAPEKTGGIYSGNTEELLDQIIQTRKVLRSIGIKTNWFRRG